MYRFKPLHAHMISHEIKSHTWVTIDVRWKINIGNYVQVQTIAYTHNIPWDKVPYTCHNRCPLKDKYRELCTGSNHCMHTTSHEIKSHTWVTIDVLWKINTGNYMCMYRFKPLHAHMISHEIKSHTWVTLDVWWKINTGNYVQAQPIACTHDIP